MKDVKISLIIPVYNVDIYIKECLDSIINQGFQDYEIICIDDASTDCSGEILSDYEKQYSNIRVFRNLENKGLSAARNIGLENASGKYIWFIDSDDWIVSDSLIELYNIAEKNQTDIVYFNMMILYDEEDCRKLLRKDTAYLEQDMVCTGRDFFSQSIINGMRSSSACVQFIKKDFLIDNKIEFYYGILHEDELFSFFLSMLAQRVISIDKEYYVYRQRKKNSIMSSMNYKRAESLFVVIIQILIYWGSHSFSEEENKTIGYYFEGLCKTYQYYRCFNKNILELSVGGYIEKLLYGMNQKKFKNVYLKLNEAQIERISYAKKVIIFGSGRGSLDIINILMERSIKVDSVAVSSMEGNPETFCGIKVNPIENISYDTEDVAVIIGVTEKYSSGIKSKLGTLGYENIIIPESVVNITVIIPIHNSEKYLKECIESVLSQTFGNIELLCIDSGTDLSFDIIKKMKEKDNRIIYIRDIHTGYGHKLNAGIRRAKGDYIAILDSDDRMSSNMLEKLYNIAEWYNADIVDADYYGFFYHKDQEYYEPIMKYSNFNIYNHPVDCFDSSKKEIATSGIWTAIYKREFLEKQSVYLNESEGASYQDMSFLFLTSILSRTVYHLNIPLYQYRMDNIESSVRDDKKVFDIIDECVFLKQELEKHVIRDKTIWKLYYIRKYNAFYWNYCRLPFKSRGVFLKRYLEELKGDIQSGMINRDMFRGDLYNRTFLLLDDRDKFINIATEYVDKSWKKEFCDLLDIIGDRGTVVFGVGVRGKKLIYALRQKKHRILGICDNSKLVQGTDNNGFIVMSVKGAVEKFRNALYVIASKKHADEMKQQLLEEGIREVDIIIFEG